MLSPIRSLTLPVALLVAALQVLCALGGSGSVLCVEQDGCVAIEGGPASCCADDDRRSSEDQRVDRPSLHQAHRPPSQARSHPSGYEGRCLECTDVRIEAGDQRPARPDAPCLCLAPAPVEICASRPAPLRVRTPATILSVDRRPLQALETVVLRR